MASGLARNIQQLIQSWPPSAQLAFRDAIQRGLSPAQAGDFASVQYGESGFNPQSRNTSSGAAGLYQLLSSGYVNRANQLGGVYNPQANIEAILPDYANYYRSNPGLVPGAAGSAVERSGEPASYYAQGYAHLPGISGLGGVRASQLQGLQGPTPTTPPEGSVSPSNGLRGSGSTRGLGGPPAPTPQQLAASKVSTLGRSFAVQLAQSTQALLNGGTPNLGALFALAKNFQEAKASLGTPRATTPPLGGSALARGAGYKA